MHKRHLRHLFALAVLLFVAPVLAQDTAPATNKTPAELLVGCLLKVADVIEPAAGLTRAVLAFLLDAYDEDEAPNAKGGVDKRTVLRFDPRLAPVKAAVLPLSRHENLTPKAKELAARLRRHWNIEFDDAGAIGRRYRRQDEIGTPFCVTVDFDSLDDDAVTVRERDTMAQERLPITSLVPWLAERLPAF